MELVRAAVRDREGPLTNDDQVALVIFTRDLRVTDHPALTAAGRASRVVCAFIHDAALKSGRPMHPLRTRFLSECLADLDVSLRRLGSRLEVREGKWVDEVLGLAAQSGARSIHMSDDVTPYAQRRFARLEAAAGQTIEVCRSPGLTTLPPGVLTPAGGDHYRVFTPFYRRWLTTPRRHLLPPPAWLPTVDGTNPRPWSRSAKTLPTSPLPLGSGGEHAAATRLAAWAAGGITRYGEHRDDLAEPAHSGLSRDLHFGCISPLQVEILIDGLPGAGPFLRQLCWRDFYLQILAARPEAAWSDYVERGRRPRTDPVRFEAWRKGRTGVPIVDAAMRQLALEGFLPNRARMIAASFLTRNLGLDWRDGARHFLEHLVDADVALNNLNWQWMAGRGTGANPHRVLSPTRQGNRFDPDGAYVRRHVPELLGLDSARIHEPWRLGRRELARLGYQAPIVPLGDVVA
ncbi:MAG: deoxyribodipyrimidine photo-lyase [Acidimicrobiales bacterium]